MPKRFVSPIPADKKLSKKKRILFIRKTTAFGGSEIVILGLLRGIDYTRNTVFLASSVDVFSKIISSLNLPAKWIPITAPFTGSFLHIFLLWFHYFKALRPSKIIVAEGGFRDFPLPIVFAAFIVARGNVWMMALHPAPEPVGTALKPRFGIIPRMGLSERGREWVMKGILSVSQGVKDRLVSGYGYTPEKICVVHNGIDTNHFSPVSRETRLVLRRDLKIPSQGLVVVCAARLDKVKRLDRLIQAFSVLSLDRNDLYLVLTGEGPLRDELKSLARSVPNGHRIKFLGYVEDVCPVLQACDFFVLPSDEEGFGIALVEAMACELVCVSTKTVGPLEIIDHGRNGFLTDLTYDGVFHGLKQVLDMSDHEREVVGKCARKTVVDRFRVEESVAGSLAYMQIEPTTGIVR